MEKTPGLHESCSNQISTLPPANNLREQSSAFESTHRLRELEGISVYTGAEKSNYQTKISLS